MKISIITPVYNNVNTIEKTILSVIRQKNVNVEYIIVDGDSTDGTVDVIKKYENDIDIFISERDKGISDAYNKGIRLATGHLIGIVAADDQLIDGSLNYIFQNYNGSDIICGNVIEYDGERYIKRRSNPDLRKLISYTSIEHPATYITKSAYLKYGLYSLDYKCAIDRELLLRFYLQGASFQLVDHFFSFMSDGVISRSNPVKYAFPEDYKISIEFGMNGKEARKNYLRAVFRYKKNKIIKKTLKTLRLSFIQIKWFQLSGKYLTNKEISCLRNKIN